MSRSFLAAVVAARFVSILYGNMCRRGIDDADGESLYLVGKETTEVLRNDHRGKFRHQKF